MEHAVETLGLPRTLDPAVALTEEVARTVGHVDWLAARIREMDPDALVFGVRETREKFGGGEFPESVTVTAAVPSIWLDVYQRERRHLVTVCAEALRAGVQERQLRIAEEVGGMLVDAIQGVLSELGVESTPEVGAIVARHLRALPAA